MASVNQDCALSTIDMFSDIAAQKDCGTGGTDKQQLKAAIALVRSEATFLLPSAFEIFNSVLSQIEQRTAV